MIKVYRTRDQSWEGILQRRGEERPEIENRVEEVLRQVRERGNAAVFGFTQQFDGVALTPEKFRVAEEEFEQAYARTDEDFLSALRRAKENILAYHRRQRPQSWWEPDQRGNILGQLINPLARVGIYVPGGTAAYPSTVLMTALPAVVAGVPEIVMMTPPGSGGDINPCTLVAAREAGVTEVYRAGGAQAIAALAYGTETLRPVDKIVGPGNIYVTLAKKLVYGQVDIDMLAGPSEVLVLADEGAPAAFVAADMIAQAEHDVMAAAVLVTSSERLAGEVQAELERQLAVLPRREIASVSLADYGGIILVENMDEGIEVVNRFAPEHLEVMVQAPFTLLGRIRNAGAIFLGMYTPEPVGDYYAGPSHVLPTGGTARFYSPLGVDTFIKRSSILSFTAAGLGNGADDIIRLASLEGLEAHANSIRIRKPHIGG
ncbi:MAG: histidinol dehydrogenase [Bacillota bacterium]